MTEATLSNLHTTPLIYFRSRPEGQKIEERKGRSKALSTRVRPPLDFIASFLSQEYKGALYS
jgi:hypothetical protein